MLRVLLIIWPAFIPIGLFLIWYVVQVGKAKKQPDATIPRLRDGPWVMTLIASIIVAIICFVTLSLTQEQVKGQYTPAVIQEGGGVVDGHIEPAPH